MKMLIITEKPSVSQAIASVLGVKNRKNGYWEGEHYIVSWCLGHLVALAQAEVYDPRFAKWNREDLPIFPQPWQTTVLPGTKKQFDVLQRLLNDSSVDRVICATDAGREGELIFRLVYEQSKSRKPVKRLWISSMEGEAIRDGMAHLRDSSEYDRLYRAALCRARADWLVGINMTRLLSTMYNRTLNVGRVMSPTLAMITRREQEIAAFVPEPFYTVVLHGDIEAISEKMKSKEEAQRLAAACQGTRAMVRSVRRKEVMQKPPCLYDLTTLQREANRLFGFTAQQTLDYAQSLYEKRLITYPRTDSRYLRTEQGAMLPTLVKQTAAAFPFSQSLMLPINAAQTIDNARVSDHHAIIPTNTMPETDISGLPEGERSILAMIAARLMCAVGDAHRYEETVVTVECGGQMFKATGKRVTNMGWKIPDTVFRGSNRMKPDEESENNLPEVTEGMTKALERYTEDSILLAMERAGADAMPEGAEHRGIGTPATRAGIIEKLVRGGYVERQGGAKVKRLVPTQKGINLAAVLPEQVKSAGMTAQWEHMLADVESGSMTPEAFMEAIQTFVEEEVRAAKPAPDAERLFPAWKNVIGVCPHCGSPVVETERGYFCDQRECHFALWKDNRYFASLGKPLTREMAMALITDGCVPLRDLRSRKTGKTYAATVLLTMDEQGNVKYSLAFPPEK